MENLALFNKTTISSIKKRYGSKLERAEVPFLGEGKIDFIVKKTSQKTFQTRTRVKEDLRSIFPSRKELSRWRLSR